MGAKDFVGSLFLKELFKGLAVTGRYMFARKITVQFPEEKRRRATGFVACMHCVVIRMVKSVALRASFARLFVRHWQLPSSPKSGMIQMGRAHAARHAMTSI